MQKNRQAFAISSGHSGLFSGTRRSRSPLAGRGVFLRIQVRMEHRRIRNARAHAVAADSVARILESYRFGKIQHSAFGGSIDRRAVLSDKA